jgi:hypothetical protein
MATSVLTAVVIRSSPRAGGLEAVLWHTIRDLPIWTQGDDIDLRLASAGSFIFVDVDCASIGDELYVCAVDSVHKMPFLTIRTEDGEWQPWVPIVDDQTADLRVTDAAVARVGGELHICIRTFDPSTGDLRAQGGVWHTILHGPDSRDDFANVKATKAGDPGLVVDLDCVAVNGELHLCCVTNDGRLWHTIRHGSGWDTFQDVEATAAGVIGPAIAEVSTAEVASELHVSALIDRTAHNLWHTIRRATTPTTWAPFDSVQTRTGWRGPLFDRVASAGVGGQLHVCATTADFTFEPPRYRLWHATRSATGPWSQFEDVEGLTGPIARPGDPPSEFHQISLSPLVVPSWQHIGHAPSGLVALAAMSGRLFAVTTDNTLWMRDPVPEDVSWQQIGSTPNSVVALAAMSGRLFAVTTDNTLWMRDPVPEDMSWQQIGSGPNGGVAAMFGSSENLLAATRNGKLWLRAGDPSEVNWREFGEDVPSGVVAMAPITNVRLTRGGRLFVATADNKLWMRDFLSVGLPPQNIASAPGMVGMAAISGFLFAATRDDKLWMRESFFGLSHRFPLLDVYLGIDTGMGNAPVIDARAPLPNEPPLVDLGPMQMGLRSTKVVTVRCVNVGSADLTVTKSSSSLTGDFHESAPGQNSQLSISPDTAAAGGVAVATLSFAPTESGAYSGTLTLQTNAPDAPAFSISIRASVEGLSLEITPATDGEAALDFGRAPIGNSMSLPIMVRNIGTVDAFVLDLVLADESPAGQFQVPSIIPDRTVPVGETRTFHIWYSPIVVGEAQATIHLVAESMPAPAAYLQTYVIMLRGTGLGPVVTLVPESLTFPDQLGRTTSSAQTVTLTNSGSAPLLISRISTSYEFVQTNSCPTSLGVGDDCLIEVSFHPAGAGTRAGVLTIDDNAPGSPHTVALTGSGLLEPILTLRPPALDFGDQPVATSGAEQTIIMANDGAADLHITDIAVTGPNAGDFAVTANTCRGTPATLPPERTCAVTVRFTPTATGTRNADLEFTDDAGGSPHQAALTGTGTTPPALTLNPTSLAFGNQAVGTASASLTITVSNNSSTPSTINSVEATGTDAGDFILTDSCRGVTLSPGETCSVDVVFAPTGVGGRRADLTFTDTTPDSPQTVPLGGTGTGPAASLQPASLVFPDQPVGSFSQRRDVTLSNTGNAPLTISSITTSGDFRHTTFCGTALPAGAFCIVSIICSPTAVGPRTGELVVVDNAAGSPHKVLLEGTGMVP